MLLTEIKIDENVYLSIEDYVIVTNFGHSYSTYYEIFKQLGLKNPYTEHTFNGFYPERGCREIFTVIGIAKDDMLLLRHSYIQHYIAIEDSVGRQFVIAPYDIRLYRHAVSIYI